MKFCPAIGFTLSQLLFFTQKVRNMSTISDVISALKTAAHPVARALHKGDHFKVLMIGFNKDSFGVIGAEAVGMGSFSFSKDIKISLRRWGDRDWTKAEGQIWRFGEQGICEPIKVRFEDKLGNSREMSFHPLTGGVVN